MKMYGGHSDADLDMWQQFPQVASVLTSSLFGAWLLRRDENKAKQFPTMPLTKVERAIKEIENIATYDGIYVDRAYVLEILDKLIENET